MKKIGGLIAIATSTIFVQAVVGQTHALAQSQGSGAFEAYGSSFYVNEFPNVLFLLGQISDGDSLEFRKALRAHDIKILVVGSPGGSVVEGLQIAGIAHDKSIATYIPPSAMCASACSYIFFAGSRRLASGALGVHQFYDAGVGANNQVTQDQATSSTQAVAAEIIDALNEYSTPPFVYVKMFSTNDIYFFSDSEKININLESDSIASSVNLGEINSFIDNLNSLEKQHTNPASEENSVPQPSAEPTPQVSAPSDDSFTVLYDTDLFGMDLLSDGIKDISISECQSDCAASPICQSYTYLPQQHWCWPKSGVGEKMYKQDAVSAVKDAYSAQIDAPQSSFRQFSGQDISGEDIYPSGVKNLTLSECRSKCELDSNCVAFSYVIKKSWCWPKFATGNMSTVAGIISGIK